MHGKLDRLSVLVDNHDEAIAFYVERLGFEVLDDGALNDKVRQTPEDVPVHFEDCNENRVVLVELKECRSEQ